MKKKKRTKEDWEEIDLDDIAIDEDEEELEDEVYWYDKQP